MTTEDQADVAAFRTRIREFLQTHLPPDWEGIATLDGEARDEFVTAWRKTLVDHHLLAITWPPEYGGAGLSLVEQVVLHEEFARRGAPTGHPNDGHGMELLGPSIMALGTKKQKKHLIPRILSGEDRWCQGFSEPDAGSDLANVATRAELEAGVWRINGQKIWTSDAHTANWIFILARTDPDAPKHRGITFLLVPLDQPGVEVRPITNMAGHIDFNEVFFTDASTAAENVLGGVNDGWRVARTVLGFERGGRSSIFGVVYREELDRLLGVVRARGVGHDPVLRQRLAAAFTRVEIIRYLGMRSLSAQLSGRQPGPESSLMKLLWSEHHAELTELALDIIGPAALTPTGRQAAPGPGLDAVGAPYSTRSWVDVWLRSRAGTIYAGTSQIQRNIVAERIIGLPRESKPDDGPGRRTRSDEAHDQSRSGDTAPEAR